MLAVAIRIAQRLGIHNESSYAKYTALEAEMCRRLWWSLIIFDNRICEMSDQKTGLLNPSWNCKTPLNINDFDILAEMHETPTAHSQPTEALFAVIRSELGDFVRHSAFHLDFTNPSLKSIAEPRFSGRIDLLERFIEDERLKYCNPENPLHFMIIWSTRGYIAKCRLVEHFSKCLRSPSPPTEVQRNEAVSFAMSILECDTRLMASPLTKRYSWLIRCHFPFPAYIQLLQDLKRRPLEENTEQMWKLMSENCKSHFFAPSGQERHPLFKMFSGVVLQAWMAYEAARVRENKSYQIPFIVSAIQTKLAQMASNGGPESESSPGIDTSMPVPVSTGEHSTGLGMEWQLSRDGNFGNYFDIPRQLPLEIDASQLDWSAINWNPMYS